jgi:hypothetical protein
MPAEVKRAKNDWPWIAWVTEKRREAEYTPEEVFWLSGVYEPIIENA